MADSIKSAVYGVAEWVDRKLKVFNAATVIYLEFCMLGCYRKGILTWIYNTS